MTDREKEILNAINEMGVFRTPYPNDEVSRLVSKLIKDKVKALENQKTGHWISRDEWFDDEEKPRLAYGCDRCGFSLKNSHEKRGFCPNCGAKMKG